MKTKKKKNNDETKPENEDNKKNIREKIRKKMNE